MLSLLISTFATSAVDCINPIAIAEQFVLQGMVKKRWHIWFFMMALCFTNLTSGLIVYYGFGKLIFSLLKSFFSPFGALLYALELMLGIALFLFTVRILYKRKNGVNDNAENESEMKIKVRSVRPFSLVVIGIITTLSELTTALPYFAFLAILLGYTLSLWQVLLILLLYNLIYISPQILMYVVYVKKQELFDRFYSFLKEKMSKWSAVLYPVITSAVGLVLVIHSALNLAA
ncbi:MAG TPA: GAP family protein [Oscillospiraceae bacterium]|nr:GAP family protein [Oscillospiraceae bacterium]